MDSVIDLQMMRRTDEQVQMMSDAVGGRRSLGRSVPSIPTVGITFDVLLDSLPVQDTSYSCMTVRAYVAVPTSYSVQYVGLLAVLSRTFFT